MSSSKTRNYAGVFWPWEAATGAPASAIPGMLKPSHTAVITGVGTATLAILFWPVLGSWGLPLAVVLARLMALDLTTHTLPDVYTMPLLAVGLVHGLGQGDVTGPAAALLVLVAYKTVGIIWPNQHYLGGGDMKLLAAMLTGLGVPLACWAAALGCLLWLPVAFLRPRAAQPLGVPLILGGICITLAAPFIL